MEEEIKSNEDLYIEIIGLISSLNPNDSIFAILDSIAKIPEELKFKDAILNELNQTRVFPDSLMKILTYTIYIQSEREIMNKLYEDSMERYERINKLTAKYKPTEDEAKIKKTLTDFILKIESIYESHDKSIEAVLRELARHLNEQNMKPPFEKEVLFYKISQRSFTQLQPSFVTLLEVYFNYIKNKNIMERLIKISNYIIEDAERKQA
jgi:hypothetical protein